MAASLLLPTFSAVGCVAPTNNSSKEEGRDVFRFTMISDIHLQTHEMISTYNFARAIEQCEERAEAARGNYLLNAYGQAYTYSQQILMDSKDLSNADQIKAAFESADGATLKVQRDGTSFSIYVDNVLIAQKDFGGAHFYNYTFFVFNADTVASFGVSAYGGEANYSDFQVQIDQ